jgi:hypothetical protein
MNVTTGMKKDIQLMRGLHRAADIHWLDYKRDY